MPKPAPTSAPDPGQVEAMHDVYRAGGAARAKAPHVVYAESECPHPGCNQRMQAIDFCLEQYGRAIHDRLVQAWWSDTGFAGPCPSCRRWIHFTIRSKRPITPEAAAQLPQLPPDWHSRAVIL